MRGGRARTSKHDQLYNPDMNAELWKACEEFLQLKKVMKCFLKSHILCPHSSPACPFFFTRPCNYYCPPHIFTSCGELLWNSCGIRSDLLGAVMTFGSSLMQPSSSMWTSVALRVTTPFPLHTLLGSRAENIQNMSLTSTAPHCSRHSRLILSILRVHSCFRANGNPNYRYLVPQMTKIEV